jgi:peroxiredoxin
MDAVVSRLPWRSQRRRLMNIFLLAALCALPSGTKAEDAEGQRTQLVAAEGATTPLFALPSLDGAKQELARFRGRVVLVHFFATWCEPCRAEMASLKELHNRLTGQPFAILPVSVAEADGTVRRFFETEPPPFTILLDRDRSVAKSWNIHALPSTLVLDRGLKPRFLAEGDVDWVRSDVMRRITNLLDAPD